MDIAEQEPSAKSEYQQKMREYDYFFSKAPGNQEEPECREFFRIIIPRHLRDKIRESSDGVLPLEIAREIFSFDNVYFLRKEQRKPKEWKRLKERDYGDKIRVEVEDKEEPGQ